MRHHVGNVLKDQAYCERIEASPLNSVECGNVGSYAVLYANRVEAKEDITERPDLAP